MVKVIGQGHRMTSSVWNHSFNGKAKVRFRKSSYRTVD